jgi:hypothetical protein|tara:strand:- start:16195 stop:17067 length:873 start_codon:yes stop_codon:yes gene_type:complete
MEPIYKPIQSEYYGDNTRWFIATVIDASPPYGLEGRVKIRVHGLHTKSTKDIPQNDLPWAQCVIPTTEGGVSGLGRIPQLQSSALVFGIFMDGSNSQIPIVIGSLPHIELPTILQSEQALEDIGDDTKPNSVWENIVKVFEPKDVDVQNTNIGNINGLVKQSREKATVRFFLNIGYSMSQSIAVASGLSLSSGMRTGVNVQSQGLANWSVDRYSQLKSFSSEYTNFYTQLAFIAFELRGTQNGTNIRLIAADKLESTKGTCYVFTRYYLENQSLFNQTVIKSRRLLDRIG